MTDWTDDELGALLTDTFRSREALADPDAAIRIADRVPGHARRWPVMVAAAASVAILVTGMAYLVNQPDQGPEAGTPGPSPSTAVSTRGLTDADNLRTAAKESVRVLSLAPLPPGARAIPGEPARWPADAGFGMSPSNKSLTRTAWYTVTLSAGAVQAFLLSHHPLGMVAEEGEGVGNSTGVRTYDYVTPHPRDPAAYTAPSLLVQWYDLGATTAIRFDAVLASRRARTPATYLTGTVTSVDIQRTVESHTGHGSTRTLPRIRLTSSKDGDGLERLVAALNGLYGAVVSTSLHDCPGILKTTTYRFSFHTERGVVVYRWVDDSCYPEIDVLRGGHLVSPRLDPGELRDTVTEVLTGSHAQ